MREVSTTEVRRFAEHLKAEADDKSEGSTTAGPRKSELSEAEYEDLAAQMKANAEVYGRRRN